MWAGAKVHDCIERTLTNLQRGISILDVDQIVDITLNKMREEFRSSRDKRYQTHPKTCALFEHEYEVQISNDEWKNTAGKVEQCLRNFYSSDTFDMLKEIPSKMWLEVEDFSSFKLNDTKIWAVLDCSFRTEDDSLATEFGNLIIRYIQSRVTTVLKCVREIKGQPPSTESV